MSEPLLSGIRARGMVPLAIHSNPFAPQTAIEAAAEGQWLDAIIASVPDLPERFHEAGAVTIEQAGRMRLIPRHFWARGKVTARLRFKAVQQAPVTIHLHMAPVGGGAKGKKIMALIATIALVAVASFISAGALSPILGAGFAAGSFGAQAAALAVGFVGRLAITMLLSPAAKPQRDNKAPELGQAGASGNVIEPGGIFYRVAGQRRLFPQLASYPLVELVDKDEIVEATYRLTGPHALSDLEVEETPASQVTGLEFRLDDGTANNPTRLVKRYGLQTTPQKELDGHRRMPTNLARLENQAQPEESLPKPWTVTSQRDPDEIWLQFLWPAGAGKPSEGGSVLIPLRITAEAVGTAIKINLPELMFTSNITSRFSKMVVLTWDEPIAPLDRTTSPNSAFAFHTVPAQTVNPAGIGGWTTHASFGNGAAPYNANSRVTMQDDRFVVHLDEAVFPRGQQWRLTIKRGIITRYANYANTAATFDPANYTPAGSPNIFDLFGYFTSGGVHYTANSSNYLDKSVVDACILMRHASVWNKSPNPEAGNAVIEVRGVNINVTQLSVLAGGLVPSWDGVSFDGLAVSKNPADHFRQALSGPFTQDPAPTRLINDPALAAWHGENVSAGREVSLVMDGRLWRETLDAIAGAGLAKRSESRRFGVLRTRDTYSLGVTPRQVFSHLNMLNFRWDKDMAAVPDAIRARFPNRDNRWQNDYVLVKRPGLTDAEVNTIISMDAIAMDGRSQVEEFFRLYLAGAWHRNHTFTFDTWFEGLAAEEGDIIGLNHLKLARQHRAHRITAVARNGGNEVVGLDLDLEQDSNEEAGLESLADLNALADMQMQGVALAGTILTGPGIATHPLQEIPVGTRTVTFDTPFSNDNVKPGQMLLIGEPSLTYRRCEVVARKPAGEMTHTLVCVAEAPEMWSP